MTCLCHDSRFDIINTYLQVPCGIELICALTAENVDSGQNSHSCENFLQLHNPVSKVWNHILSGLCIWAAFKVTFLFCILFLKCSSSDAALLYSCLLKVCLARAMKVCSCALLLLLHLLFMYLSPFPPHPSEGLIAYVMSLNICATLGEVRHAKTVQNVPLCTP